MSPNYNVNRTDFPSQVIQSLITKAQPIDLIKGMSSISCKLSRLFARALKHSMIRKELWNAVMTFQ